MQKQKELSKKTTAAKKLKADTKKLHRALRRDQKPKTSTELVKVQAPAALPDLQLVRPCELIADRHWYIHGAVRNNSQMMFSSVEVHFNLYDGEGAQIGTAWTITSNWSPA